ncbi:MAG: UDP-N-acetylmuramoyl-L-alanyl-D-glutamate--2,6-diaminopimelate ligase [bacterium]|nr:UDP-N-acetylmuramoyl-L-alanyl-D-glutamate--2,6-diaminopimelate ligase [bacterium]
MASLFTELQKLHPTGISADSREDQKGKVFVAYRGVSIDGHKFIDEVIKGGAVAIVGEKKLDHLPVPYYRVADGRLAWAQLVAGWYGNPERHLTLIGVTGTDGKTTTSHLIYEMLKAAKLKVGLVSTVAAYIGADMLETGAHVTSPDPDKLWHFLALAVDRGVKYLVLEVTSHALDQRRYGDLPFEIGVLTNLTHEHLDYHRTWTNYRKSKARLFKQVKYAVLNQDDPSFNYFNTHTTGKITSYTRTKIKVTNPVLAGEYNKSNIGAAESVAKLFHIPQATLDKVIHNFVGVPGRLEEIKIGQTFRAIVDFAHTPNALEKLLTELRSQLAANKQLILVFGCAGRRDAAKRPMMGQIATKLADQVIITAEDPRTESLDEIYQQITQGKGKFIRQDDRQQAINHAVRLAKGGDIVVVAGKGHERSMCFGKTEYPWSDQKAVKQAVTGLLK